MLDAAAVLRLGVKAPTRRAVKLCWKDVQGAASKNCVYIFLNGPPTSGQCSYIKCQ